MEKAYCYGMVSPSTALFLADGFSYPAANSYAEVVLSLLSVGGEAANSAVVLAKFGVSTLLDGVWIAASRRDQVFSMLAPFGIDLSLLNIVEAGGTAETIIADGRTRTVFGNYAAFHSGPRQWNEPSEQAIRDADIVCLDPYFKTESRRAAEICVQNGVPYVTHDARHDDYIGVNAAAVIVSHELTGTQYRGRDPRELFADFRGACSGLVVFTFGGDELWYGRRDGESRRFLPYPITPVDSTGAGDAFRGAVAYGLVHGWADDRVITFAAAVAAQVCLTRPHALGLPDLEIVSAFMADQSRLRPEWPRGFNI